MNDILPEEKKIFPCIWQALLLLFVSFIALLVTGVGVAILDAVAKALKNDLFVSLTTYLQSLANLILLPIALGVLYFTKASFKEIFSFKSTKAIYILPLIVLILGSSVIESEMDNVVRYIIPMPEFIQEIMMGLIQNKVSSFILLVIIASLTEELLCRGVILRGFLSHYSKTKSIIVSAMLFSLFHMNIYQFFSAFLLGLILGWVYAETRSLYLCFFVHSFHNLLCWLCAFNIINLHIPGYSFDGEVDYNLIQFQPLWFNALGIVLCVVGFFLLKKIFSKTLIEEEFPLQKVESNSESQEEIEQGGI